MEPPAKTRSPQPNLAPEPSPEVPILFFAPSRPVRQNLFSGLVDPGLGFYDPNFPHFFRFWFFHGGPDRLWVPKRTKIGSCFPLSKDGLKFKQEYEFNSTTKGRPLPKFPPRIPSPGFPAPFFLALLFLSVLALYLPTLNPSLFRNDSPETITACVTLGIAHPPSYPLHSLLGRLFSLLGIGNPAFTLNLFSCCLSALGVCLFAGGLRILFLSLGPSPAAAKTSLLPLSLLAGSWMFAFSGNYWSCSLSAKGGIYILQMVLDLALIFNLLRLIQLGTFRPYPLGQIYFLAFLFSAGLVNHWPTQTLLVPALAFLFFRLTPPHSTVGRPSGLKMFFTIASFAALVLSLYLYLPLRAGQYPELNFGCPNTAYRFMASVLRLSYARVETLFSAGPYTLSTLTEKASYLLRRLLHEFHPLAWVFFAGGILSLARHKTTLYFILLIFTTTTLVNLFYLQAIPIEFWHIDDHLLSLNWTFGLITAVGLYSTLNLVGNFQRPVPKKALFLSLGLGLPLLVYASHHRLNDQKKQFLYRGYGLAGLKSMERNSVYFAETDFDYFSMLYLKQVEGKRNDIILILTPLLTRPYEYPLIQKSNPDLFPAGAIFPGGELNEELFFNRLGQGSLGRPFYCAFSNGTFAEMYLRHHESFHFQPSGILIKCMGSNRPAAAGDLIVPLNDFWEHYLQPENLHPQPINGLFLGICSHPFTNAAYYLEMKNDFSRWDWFYERALSLIPKGVWLADAWVKKAEGNLLAGQKGEAFGALESAALEYLKAGDIEKSKTSLQKALALFPGDQRLRGILDQLETVQ